MYRLLSLPPRRGLWQNRDFMLLWSAQGVSSIGSRITRTALPMAAILAINASPYHLGLLAVALSLPGVLVAWFAGGWVDRHPRRPLLIATDLIRAVALAAIPLAAVMGALTLPLLYTVAVITGICTVLFDIADHVFITDLVPRERLLEANAKREALDSMAEVTGPAMGGALVAWLTAPLAIAIDAFSFLVSAVLVLRIRHKETVRVSTASTSVIEDARIGMHVVWRTPPVRAMFLATIAFTLCGSFLASLYTLFALRELGLTTTQLGLAIGFGGIGALLGAVTAMPAMRRWGARRTLIGALLVAAVMHMFVPLAPAVPWMALGCLVAAQLIGDGAMTVYHINETTLRQQTLPPEALGRAAATFRVASGLVMPTGAMLGAALAEAIGMRLTLIFTGLGLAAAAGILYLSRHSLPGVAKPMVIGQPAPS
jgi:MFS family permease